MPRIAKQLGALQVRQLTKPGFHAVGGVAGLYLTVSESGARSWILRTFIGLKRSDVGLGSFPAVSLAMAHQKAQALKDQIKSGVNPISERRQQRQKIEWTFDKCASDYIELHRSSWKNKKHAAQWVSTLQTYASPLIGRKHVREVTVNDVLGVIEPHWQTKNETMVRLRNRIELVLSWAASRGYRSKENPAQWRGNLQHSLPKPSKVNMRKHHAFIPVKEMRAFVQRLELVEGKTAKALKWVILTACRSGEARGAVWSEIDLQDGLWKIPGHRMKSGRDHTVPLTSEALKLLQTLPRFATDDDQQDYIFPGRSGKQLSDMSMTQLMRRMGANAVPHGFRASFTVWASEMTNYEVELREMALAHALDDKTIEAYQRTTLVEKRRKMMAEWSEFLYS
ncbi:tyrosine-type recombinase/integrase [Limnohabitans parvus]|uniref:Integrase n=1 Tax=Limnohabitans parvus II-B4 TaxID=1293052 RepID=A0A315FQV2_9BURK|nr:site-specific integrase [Limnohabitans parvus]PUE55667.1 integrase [Limnohabitans parvus II-B4]